MALDGDDTNVVNLEDHVPHRALEVMCVKCHARWIAVAPVETLLIKYECKTCGAGFVIDTGQDMMNGSN